MMANLNIIKMKELKTINLLDSMKVYLVEFPDSKIKALSDCEMDELIWFRDNFKRAVVLYFTGHQFFDSQSYANIININPQEKLRSFFEEQSYQIVSN